MHSKSSLNFICSVPAVGKTFDKYRNNFFKKRLKVKKKENIDKIFSSREIKRRAALVFYLKITPWRIPWSPNAIIDFSFFFFSCLSCKNYCRQRSWTRKEKTRRHCNTVQFFSTKKTAWGLSSTAYKSNLFLYQNYFESI